jgi:V8-like Glu-specific endopeptidase
MRLARLAPSLLVLLLAAVPAQAERPSKSPSEIAEYWTRERMRAAVPREAGRGGEPRDVAGKPQRPGGATSWTRLAVPMPYAGADLNNGKVFMTIEGVDYVCSGTSVAATSSGVNLVWTAGHCLNEGPGDNASNFMFAPGWIDGTAPYGRWVSTGAHAATSQWSGSGDFDYDVGAARVVRTTGPPTLAAIATPRPMTFGYSVTVGSTKFKSYGYPAAGKFNGQRMYLCDSTVSRRDGSNSVAPMGIGCDMTGGSSGGGWLDASGAVGSVNSYGYNGVKNTMFGPYQGAVAQALYNSMR